MCYAHANKKDLEFGGISFVPSAAYRRRLAMGAMTLVARAFHEEKKPLTCEAMARQLGAPVRVMRNVIAILLGEGLLVELQGDDERFQPARPIGQITLGRIADAMQHAGDRSPLTATMLQKLGVATFVDRWTESEKAIRQVSLLEVTKGQSEAQKKE